MEARIRKYVSELKSRQLTKPTILLLMYLFAVTNTTIVAMKLSQNILTGQAACLKAGGSNESVVDSLKESITNNIANLYSYGLYILIPLAGWISDAKLGRSLGIKISLLAGWLATLLASVVSICLKYIDPDRHIVLLICQYGVSPVALILSIISVSFCYANVFGYGVSQFLLAGSSSIKIRAFINWAIWVIFASGDVTYMFNDIGPCTSNIIICIYSFVTFSFCLCWHFNSKHWFEEMQVENSYTLSIQVLKYAWKNKGPVNRSALTYWQDEMPGRIDFAKNKYGGPFTEEMVEMVKTFLRIIVVILALVPFLLSSDPLINEIGEFVPQYKGGQYEYSSQSKGSQSSLAGDVVWFIGDNIVLIIIPMMELVVLPLFPKLEYFLINPLKGIGLSMVSIIISAVVLAIIDIVGHALADHTVGCYSTTPHKDRLIPIPFWIMLIPSVIAGLADMLSYLYVFVFLCSQGPSTMTGTLIGIYFFIRGICTQLSALVLLESEQQHWLARGIGPRSIVSCTSVLMFILGTAALVGLVMYLLAAKWYKKRIRNDDLYLRVAVERHFENKLIQDDEHRSKLIQQESVDYTLSSSFSNKY